MSELDLLFAQQTEECAPWIRGKIPHHYKRLNIPMERAVELARLGASTVYSYFGDKCYFTQSVIAGAVVSNEYDRITIITPSTYGKSWLMGRLADIMAYLGEPTYVVASTTDGTKMIMGHVINALQSAAPEIRNELLNKKDQLERLVTSVSKQKLAFSKGGFVEPITTGDTFSGLASNKAIGKPGNYIIDEAALVSEDSFAELGRADLARIDKKKYKRIMISNPHNPGVFYDAITEPEPDERSLIIWMDALTAVEEERITKKQVYEGEFAKHRSTLRRYLLCVLDVDGEGMFATPDVYHGNYEGEYTQWFMGVDSAYKGKDNIEVTLTAVGGGKIHVDRTVKIVKKNWIDGKTSKDIIRTIAILAYEYNVSMICVDVGWGVWLVEGLAQKGLNVVGVNFAEAPSRDRIRAKHYSATNATNKRAEMHLDFQDLTDNKVLEVRDEVYDQIKDTLPYITSERKTSGKIQIRPKSEIKAMIGRSPDEFDSILLSIHASIRFLGDAVYTIT